MHYLAACLIFKESASYLGEWLRFHLETGVQHFYLYDNDSTDDFTSVLRPFIAAHQVTLHQWPGHAQQLKVYEHCLNTYQKGTRWLAMIDDDEFLFPPQHDDLKEVLSEYESNAGVAVCWLLFGSNGHKTRPPGLVTRNYTRRAAWIDRHVKCVVDPRQVIARTTSPHTFQCVPGARIVDENHQPIDGPLTDNPSANIFCINHYLTRSIEEMAGRRSRLQADGFLTQHTLEQWATFEHDYNAVEDLRVQKFVDRLQEGTSLRTHS